MKHIFLTRCYTLVQERLAHLVLLEQWQQWLQCKLLGSVMCAQGQTSLPVEFKYSMKT